MAKVEVAVVCTQAQPPDYWTAVMGRLLQEQQNGVEITRINSVRSALPDDGKNHTIGAMTDSIHKNRNNRTDANRNKVVGAVIGTELDAEGFLAGKAEWLFFIDDDTVPPPYAISRLLKLGREFAAGLYFTGDKTPIPLMYKRNKYGLYSAVDKYPKGAVIPVDAVGMGCTLIHRSVFEKIMEEHVIVQRANGSLLPVHKSRVSGELLDADEYDFGEVIDGVYHMPVYKPTGDNRQWPFFGMEYGRTEDLHFCELAANVGIRPYVDTTIVCDHLKLRPINEEQFKKYRKEALDGIRRS